MIVLVACEESQVVAKAFRAKGHDAWSCDILPCSGGHPEWHLQQDVLPLIDDDWDMIIAFPPCTDICTSGSRWFPAKRADGRQEAAIEFFLAFTQAKCPRVAIENPVGIMSTRIQKPSQIIQPWQFGDSATKTTCLWLKGLPPLKPTNIVDPGERVTFDSGKSMPKWYADAWSLNEKDRARLRSQTFHGIANAMAEQWEGNERCKTGGFQLSLPTTA